MITISKKEGDFGGIELDKRFYIPGVIVEATCPKCGRTCCLDLDDNYLSYPPMNEPFNKKFYCEEWDGDTQLGCGGKFEVSLIVRVTLEAAGGEA